ncbi:Uncharacterized conserved protein YafD, endonuclease/exonuclease/phosphatase (EEP) superfamily [Cnuella takakiae]|uniref:Uncharacterized conserved protein YafD, endonuclease/exonuclease/phosphatase (EEP) superfamily n=1 Tax=Cnuella takakiae TaxID=1302690 RepID=A0A1M4XU88_9BACT|nr:endonuclease/exonuclease/phosphatase family protein [Cnuella takakiae]OLY92941.1 hypothetical protein BUE76_14365 [Cnuella takakiae]SHE96833.1 Uncharacterized conserved protein YafD, endonuclease/exonuclease/phosphatase (EEP) superfamily [Cnuella takakiae]
MITALSILSLLLIITAALTLVRHNFWIFKVFEYPRLQKLFLMVGCLVGWIAVWPALTTFHLVLFILLLAFSLFYCSRILPYSTLWPKEIKRMPPSAKNVDLKLFAANVLQDNREYHRLLKQIKDMDADIVFLLETDEGWAQAMKELEATYPYKLLQPIDNTYGLLFYSRLKILSGKVLFRVKEGVPSIDAIVELPNGRPIQIWGLHPEPPVPGENLFSTAKDKELMKVALLARECKLPCIVFGDLNDVAWSHTTKLFRKTSGLLDPRIGRGFYSTFSAHHWWVRFPLDYIFCSTDFGLVRMKRLPPNGSDHFATFVHLVYEPRLEPVQSGLEARKEEIKEAREMATQEVEQ